MMFVKFNEMSDTLKRVKYYDLNSHHLIYLLRRQFWLSKITSFFSKYRKPNPGMILYLAKKYNINLSKSYFVGDSDTDILAGKLANLKTILVKSIKFKNYKLNVKPNFNVKNLY